MSAQNTTEIALGLIILLLAVLLMLIAPGFATLNNLTNILRETAIVGIVAWAATLIIVAGEIDISVGPAVAFWSVVLAQLAGAGGLGTPLAVLAILCGGAFVGALAGWLRAFTGIPSFIVTLGLWNVYGGLAYFLSNALPIPVPRNDFLGFLAGRMGPIPVPVVIMFVLFACFTFIVARTGFGRSIYAVGGNIKAARLSGIPVARVQIIVFAIGGLMAAIVAVMLTARLNSGNPGTAGGLEFQVIAAVVVGGTLLSGGRGSLVGTLLGVILIAVVGNGLVLLGVSSFLQDVVSGLIIVVAVLINSFVGRRAGHRLE